ncbi:phosphoheptose isomerase [Desulfobulbus propionicus DSM 2032]|uniref:Phosphoheptose isomerase n=1 Tax=Desulfobulbus propionicus (strain ATCC 33891 / DSM 2032 / VKM B-1956 / 1pr3) TaxID=577650 RepID=A0A7U3YNM4_DESPD|nr:D-sedoheptulose 7-phosphate isomerase [Desulfobulbus propionicus]ADW18709.1 phosphoheptose isomerase [Desulfobulbus propionicus DSM 2032]
MKTLISTNLVQSIMAKEAFVKESVDDILLLSEWIREVFEDGGKLLIFGNGGSAADAQHLAAEFVNRFLINRRPLPALALTTDSSVLTSIANDFSYELVFAKQIQALGKPEDLALGISTSGTSANVVKAMEAARTIGMKTVALTGGTARPGGDLAAICDLVLNVPSDSTPHIQETHLWVEHLLCEIVERQMFASS